MQWGKKRAGGRGLDEVGERDDGGRRVGGLGTVLGRLAVELGAYDEVCRGAAEEMQWRYTWRALMERWRGRWGEERDERRVTR